MPYSFPNNIPRPAKNWTESEQKKCIAAANAVLSGNGSEQDAIFACIHAAGRTENPGGKKTMTVFERLADMFTGFAKSLQDESAEKAVSRAKLTEMAAEMGVTMSPEQMASMMEAIGDMPEPEAMAAARKRMMALRGKKETFAVYKQADGNYRWFGWVSNHFRDNDNPREILSAKAHRAFVSYADKTGKYPELWLWHVPGSRIGKADMVDFADGFLVESGLFDPGREDVAEKLAKETNPLTMSHGFMRTKGMDQDGVTDGYIQFEASVTPKGPEANPWTAFSTIKEADMPLSESKKAFLSKYLAADVITSLEGKTDELRKAAEAAGVDWKTVEEAEAQATTTEPTVTPAATEAPNLDSLVGPLADAIAERLQMKALSAMLAETKAKADRYDELAVKVDALAKTIGEVKKTDDEKIASVLTPRAAQVYAWMDKAASTSPTTTLREGEKVDDGLKTRKPFLQQIAEKMAGQVPGNL